MKANIFIALLFFNCSIADAQSAYRLWYDKPATNWNEALPIGNGRLAAMVFGDPSREQVQLNEETIWTGAPYNNINDSMRYIVPELRKLLFDKKYAEAQKLSLERMR